MSKKHFIALADALTFVRQRIEAINGPGKKADDTFDAVTEELADFCASQNPSFKKGRWIAYINGEVGPNGGQSKKRGV